MGLPPYMYGGNWISFLSPIDIIKVDYCIKNGHNQLYPHDMETYEDKIK